MRADEIDWKRDENWFVSARPVLIPLIDQRVPIQIDREDRKPTLAQLEAVQGILELTPDRLQEFTHAVALDCWYTCQDFEIEGLKSPVRFRKRSQVWKHVSWEAVHVPTHKKSRDRYAFLHAECAWDVEHGLELLLQNGRLLRVGRQEGLSLNEEWELYFVNE